ncbi:MAG TPA: DUF4097 family beta strand repeat-containing protein [Thermoanaerobaculia bacterium]
MPIRNLTRKSAPLFCGLLLVGAAAQAVTLKDRFEQTVPLKPGSEVRLDNTNGGVTFEAWDRNEVHVVAEKQVRAGSDDQTRKLMSQIKIDVVPGPSGLRIETHMPKRGNGGGFLDSLFNGEVNMGVSYTVQVPRQSSLAIVNSNGALQVTGTRGNARLETSNGRITAEGVAGDLTLKTSNGRISVAHSEGTVHAETTNGGIDAELTRFSGKDLHFETSNGGVSVRLPRGARFTVDAETSNGSVQSDFQVPGERKGRHSLSGPVNGGGPTLYVRTSNGGVRIRES